MIFNALYESSLKGELILIDGCICRFHLRRNGQITILEIISTKKGAGSIVLDKLKNINGATSIFAKCPVDLESNSWYKYKGFVLEGYEIGKTGKKINLWRLCL